MGIGSEFYTIPSGVLEYCTTDKVFKVLFNKEDIKKHLGLIKIIGLILRMMSGIVQPMNSILLLSTL